MHSLRFQSVFDIIGPVMIGPSSSHTAGAVRIGKIVSSIFDDTPTEVEFQLFNSFAKTYRGHGTDLALVAGILGMDTDDPDIPNSLEIAHKRGIKIVWTIQKDSNAPHPNTTKITVKNEHKSISVTGISIGGGNIQVTELNGFAVSLNMNTPTIIIVHQDVPGMIAHVTEALSRFDINIAQMNVTREKAGEKAIMIIEVDSRSCEEAIEEIRKIPHLHNVSLSRRKHVLFYQRIGRAGGSRLPRKCRRTHDCDRISTNRSGTARSSPPHGTQSRSHESLCRARSQ